MMHIAICCVAVLITAGCAQKYIILDGNDWIVHNSNRSISIPASVPGNIYHDLRASGLIGDPIYRFNERTYSWIANESEWIFEKSFSLMSEMASNLNDIYFEFQGIDTISSIYLNDRLIGHTNNMFISWRFRLNDTILHQGESNHLKVHIQSAIRHAHEMANRTPYTLPSSDWLLYSYPHRNMIRKSQSDFGWDWGPAFAGCGIYKSVRIVMENEAYTTQCYVDQLHNQDGTVDVEITAVANGRAKNTETLVEVSFGDLKAVNHLQVIESHGEQVLGAKFKFSLSSPRLWWPRGYGAQYLYTLTCRIARHQASLTKRIGIRDAKLICEPITGDSPGETFFFRVNGVDIFAKGANLVPLSSFPTSVKRDDLEVMLQNALESNMNMIRVWGGGIYQPNELYDIADDLGILIWQELMFACATYPRDHDFLQNVALEIEQQLERLRDHPSIVVIGGNNENEAAMTWFNETRQNPALYFIDYAKLFIDTIRETVIKIAPDIAFIISSPSNGQISENPFVLRWGDANSNLFGDIHFYDYEHDCSDPDIYPDARFISEFGFQSLPSLSTLSTVATDEDLSWDSELMRFRQRHENGNQQLLDQIRRHFHVSNSTTFEQLIFLSQATQSICYRTAMEKWRRGRSKFSTMGVLYWQLNSIWPAPTWSSLEARSQKWKMLHYHVKELFAPVLVSMLKIDDSIHVHVITDSIPELHAELVVKAWSSNGTELKEYSSEFLLRAQSDVVALRILLEGNQFDIISAAINSNGEHLYQNVLMLRRFKDLPLQDPQITIEKLSLINVRAVEIRLKSSRLAAFVFLDSPISGKFSSNAPYILFPNDDYTIIFTSNAAVNLDHFARTLKISSLFDTIYSSVIMSDSDCRIAYQ